LLDLAIELVEALKPVGDVGGEVLEGVHCEIVVVVVVLAVAAAA
jgi:hypothetical protein